MFIHGKFSYQNDCMKTSTVLQEVQDLMSIAEDMEKVVSWPASLSCWQWIGCDYVYIYILISVIFVATAKNIYIQYLFTYIYTYIYIYPLLHMVIICVYI